jgi:membrane-bound lytic murein transglycosylase B
MKSNPTRRRVLQSVIASTALASTVFVDPKFAIAQSARSTFKQWVADFRLRALARGVSEKTYDRVMAVTPDTSVYALDRAQPEFREELWQYINRRVSDWRVIAGKEHAKEVAPLLDRIEKDYGVDRYVMMGLWGNESAFGDPLVQKNFMRPVIPALAALAWGEPRRRTYWEKELLNALVIIERGWSNPEEMNGSWAGAMGHTQWMPEVWLNTGVDYDKDGRVSPFGKPDDAFAGTAQYLVKRGGYRRGEPWGYEVKAPGGIGEGGHRTYAAWQKLGVVRADGHAYAAPNVSARLWTPVPRGPRFLLSKNFDAVKSYNPSNSYALAVVLLGDRIGGAGPLVQLFPGGERTPTFAEVQEIQRRLTEHGYDGGTPNGRIGRATIQAILAYQRKVKFDPVDGYAGLKLLARLRQGP